MRITKGVYGSPLLIQVEMNCKTCDREINLVVREDRFDADKSHNCFSCAIAEKDQPVEVGFIPGT